MSTRSFSKIIASLLKTNNNKILLTNSTILRFNTTTNEINTKSDELSENLLKYNLKLSKFNLKTQTRLQQSNLNELTTIIKNLHDYGIEWQRIIETLENYEDWSVFARDNLAEKFDIFRNLKLSTPLLNFIISRNEQIMHLNEITIGHQLNRLKKYFSNSQLDRLLAKTPKLLTNDFYSFQYKFTYLYCVMGFKQDEMCTSFVFNQQINHIRERHLFLTRSGFFDKPNKKGETKVQNPYLKDIVDSNIDAFLKLTTKNQFTIEDYETFCSYLNEENFEDELLGFNIEDAVQKTVIADMKINQKSKRL
jgi:hypothetical protein